MDPVQVANTQNVQAAAAGAAPEGGAGEQAGQQKAMASFFSSLLSRLMSTASENANNQ
jgi:hypothetical protein